MALVACRECGSEISESAATCPRCGVSAPAGLASLTFVRAGLTGRAIRVEVRVDGQPQGAIPMTGEIVVPVAPGSHHIELSSSYGKSAVGTINARSGDTTIKVKLSPMGTPRIE